jgi:hypothetical protein
MASVKQLVREAVDVQQPYALVETGGYADNVDSGVPVDKADRARFGSFLVAEMAQQKVTIPELCRRTGLRYAVIFRWLDPVVERRMLPSSANCHLIADALKLDELTVLRAAGHVRAKSVSTPEPAPAYWEEVRALLRREKRYLLSVPARDWPFFRALLEADVDRMRLTVERFDEAVQAAKQDASSRDNN